MRYIHGSIELMETIKPRYRASRECLMCKQQKPASEFYKSTYTTRQGKRSKRLETRCIECAKARRRVQYSANRDDELERMKRWKLDNEGEFRLHQQVVEKCCFRCKQTKPAAEFYPDYRSTDGLRADCKACGCGDVRSYSKNHEEQLRRYRLVARLKRYGLTVEAYETMLEAQAGVCAICKNTPDRFFVDHCHKSGKVRALLCFRCNTVLGNLNDDIALALKMADFLRAHQP